MAKPYIPEFEDPYPSEPVHISEFEYCSTLHLLRLPDGKELLEQVGREAQYIVGRDFCVRWKTETSDWKTITVPRGMLTDLTSVPRLFQGIVGRVGPWLEAVIVHDFLSIAWRTMDGQGTRERRLFSDDLMVAAMKEAEVGWERHSINLAIRLGAILYYPQTVDPTTQTDLYVDLDEPWIACQIS